MAEQSSKLNLVVGYPNLNLLTNPGQLAKSN